jgi:hypothetical protein
LIQLDSESFIFIKKYVIKYRFSFQKLTRALRKKETKIFSNENIDSDFMQLIIKNDGLKGNLLPIKTKPDGNCLYNSFSILLIGQQDDYCAIKIGLIFMLIEYENYFQELLLQTSCSCSYEKFVEDTCIMNSWGNEYSQVGISVLLDRPLNKYSINPTSKKCYSQQYCIYEPQVERKPLTIGFITNHFSALLPINESFVPPVADINQFLKNFEIPRVWQYD